MPPTVRKKCLERDALPHFFATLSEATLNELNEKKYFMCIKKKKLLFKKQIAILNYFFFGWATCRIKTYQQCSLGSPSAKLFRLQHR